MGYRDARSSSQADADPDDAITAPAVRRTIFRDQTDTIARRTITDTIGRRTITVAGYPPGNAGRHEETSDS